MRVRKVYSALAWRWRWDAAGMVGYCLTRHGALRAARRAMAEAR